MNKLAYYPGCSGHGTSKEYDSSTRAVCKALGLEFCEIDDWNCCGSTPAHAMDTVLSGALAARNFKQIALTGADSVVTPCPSCLSNLKLARRRMQNPDFKAKVDSLLDSPTVDDAAQLPETYSVLQLITEKFNMDELKSRVTYPLEGVKIATYYGCILTRPADVMQFDDPENPVSLDRIMTALGAEVIDFPLKTECCGASMGVSRQDVTGNLSGRIISEAKKFGADAIVTACPLCHMNLDLRQHQAARTKNFNFRLPIFYYTQLMGLAFGLPSEQLRFDKLAVDPAPFFQLIADRRQARIDAEAAKAKAAAEKAAAAEKKAAASAQGAAS